MNRESKRKIIKSVVVYGAGVSLMLFAIAVSVGAGSGKADLGRIIAGIFSVNDPVVNALMRVNLPRTWVALCSGATLAVAGALFRTATGNPLADPSIIGISSSTYACGLFISMAFPFLIPFAPFFASAFGMLVFMLIFWLSYSRGLNVNRILAAGAAVNAVFMMVIITAAVMQSLSATSVLLSLSGSLAVPRSETVVSTAVLTGIGLAVAVFFAGRCNILSLGDKTAQSLGVNVFRMKIILAGISVFLVATAAVNVGVTAFLGLLAPMAAKKLLGANHFRVIPLSAILGGLILLAADCFGRAMNTPVTLPVGIITTVCGGAAFIVLLRRNYRNAD